MTTGQNNKKDQISNNAKKIKSYPPDFTVGARPGEAYKPQCLANTVKFGGGSVMIWWCFSKAGIEQFCLCEGRMNQATYKVVLEENLVPSALTMFPNSEDFFSPQRQCSMPHSQVNQGVVGGPPDQDPVMASPISRPEPH